MAYTVRLEEVVEMLNSLKNEYDNLRALIEDQVRDNEIDEAHENFHKLLDISNSINQMENLEVNMPSNET